MMIKDKIFKKNKVIIIVLAICTLLSVADLHIFAENYGGIPMDNAERASAIYLYNVEKDLVLVQKDSKKIMDPASTVKIMTAIVAYDAIKDINSSVIITKSMIGNAETNLMKLKVNEKISIKDLFAGMICCGYNDAATALAVISFGSTKKFVEQMNIRAKEIGAYDTVYGDVTGIGDSNRTTAYDTAMVAKEFVKRSFLLEISDMPSYTVERTNLSDERKFHNRNAMISNYTGTKYLNSFADGLNFGMTGTGGYSLVTSASKEGITYICVVLNGDYDKDKNIIYSYLIANQILNYVNNNLGYQDIVKKGQLAGSLPVVGASISKEKCEIVIKDDVRVYLPADYKNSDLLKCTYVYYKDKLKAPVSAGTCVGKLVVSYGDDIVAVEDMVLSEDIELDNFMYALAFTKGFLSSKGFIAGLIAFAISVIFYVFHNSKTYKSKKRKKQRRKNNYMR